LDTDLNVKLLSDSDKKKMSLKVQVLSEIDSGRFWKTVEIIPYFQNQKRLEVFCIIGLFFLPFSFFFLWKKACTG